LTLPTASCASLTPSCYGELAQCGSDGLCSCKYDYAKVVDPIDVSRECVKRFEPCSAVGFECLGEYGTCNSLTGVCDCEEGTRLAAVASVQDASDLLALVSDAYSGGVQDASWRLCVPDVASTDDQRKFWAVSLWLSAWGFVGIHPRDVGVRVQSAAQDS